MLYGGMEEWSGLKNGKSGNRKNGKTGNREKGKSDNRGIEGQENGKSFLQLSVFDEDDDSLDDLVFVLSVILFLEVVAEEFCESLPESCGYFASVEFDEFVTCDVALPVHEFHEHLPLFCGEVAQGWLVFPEQVFFELVEVFFAFPLSFNVSEVFFYPLVLDADDFGVW